jgi:cobalamin-dependent methionine synthase I
VGEGVLFHSSDLSRFLQGAEAVIVAGATAGEAVTQARDDLFGTGNAGEAVLWDAVGSETAEAALEWLLLRAAVLFRAGAVPRRRFSCGYGDFGLENQETIVRILDLGALGVSVSGSFYLYPEKSVTALSGFWPPGFSRSAAEGP